MEKTANFLKATRENFTFNTQFKGTVNVIQLWSFPLTSTTKDSLESIWNTLQDELASCTRESPIKRSSPMKSLLEQKVAIVEEVMKTLQDERDKKRSDQEARATLARLQEIEAESKDDALKNMTAEDRAKMIADLQAQVNG